MLKRLIGTTMLIAFVSVGGIARAATETAQPDVRFVEEEAWTDTTFYAVLKELSHNPTPEQAERLVRYMAENDALGRVSELLRDQASLPFFNGARLAMVQGLRALNNPSVLPAALYAFEGGRSLVFLGGEMTSSHDNYLRNVLHLVAHLTDQETSADSAGGMDVDSEEAKAIIAEAKVWWKANGHMHGGEPLINITSSDGTKPSPNHDLPPGNSPRPTRKDANQAPPVGAIAEPPTPLWPIWLGAGLLCTLVAAGALYLRRKRAA